MNVHRQTLFLVAVFSIGALLGCEARESHEPEGKRDVQMDKTQTDTDERSDVDSDGDTGEVSERIKASSGLSDRLEDTVERLSTEFENRDPGSPGTYRRAAKYLVKKLEEIGYAPVVNDIEVRQQHYPNIIVERRGSATPDEVVVVGAHYDTVRASPGADDNATGVAAVIELARVYRDVEPKRTVRFVLFANEEAGSFGLSDETMGSYKYAEALKRREESVVMMFALEMLGYYTDEPGSQNYPSGIDVLYPDREFSNTGNFVAFVTKMSLQTEIERIDSVFAEASQVPSEHLAGPESLPAISRSDHSSFWRHGFPGVMVTDTANFRNPNYHRASDTADTIDFDTFTEVVEGLVPVIEEWSG
jgi:Zn-dependent M28 family amino/carboxypeptidase